MPALATGQARLALRTGAQWRPVTESIALVGSEFRILPEIDGRVQKLLRRAAEWWTPPEPAALTAQDLLEKAMSPANGRLVEHAAFLDLAAPVSPHILRPDRTPVAWIALRLDAASRPALPPSRPSGGATPLRL